MVIPADEVKRYYDFVNEITKELGTVMIPPDTVLWHYTNGPSLISIVETNTIFATQISGLNDTTELKYASKVFRDALASLRSRFESDPASFDFIDRATQFFKEDPEFPSQSSVPFFVSCFSEVKDDLSQWRAYGGGENGYAIGFRAGGLWGITQSFLARINYDTDLHRKLALAAAEKCVEFFNDGIKRFAPGDLTAWAGEFLDSWNGAITMAAPLVKDVAFAAERECRIVKGFVATDDLEKLQFRQKNTLMSRHLPLQPGTHPAGSPYRLPIVEVMIGPCRHKEISRTSVGTLLQRFGYSGITVSISRVPFQMA